jgi:hypothetical protein
VYVDATAVGPASAVLSWAGTDLFASGLDGPYELALIEVYDEPAGLILEDAAGSAYFTQPWLATDFERPPPPVLVSVSPNFGPVRGRQPTVVLAGTDLGGGQPVVYFGDKQAEKVEVLTSGQLSVVVPRLYGPGVPPERLGSTPPNVPVTVTVMTPSGMTTPQTYTYVY